MELSSLVAKIISIIYISSGIAVLIGTINFNDIVKDFDKSPALTFVVGSVGIIIGLILIEYHNIWVKNWKVLITIISWLFLIGGLVVVIIPKSLTYFNNLYKNSRILGLYMIAFGLIIGYFGFIK
jgi:hypothetical protein